MIWIKGWAKKAQLSHVAVMDNVKLWNDSKETSLSLLVNISENQATEFRFGLFYSFWKTGNQSIFVEWMDVMIKNKTSL